MGGTVTDVCTLEVDDDNGVGSLERVCGDAEHAPLNATATLNTASLDQATFKYTTGAARVPRTRCLLNYFP